MEWDNTLSGNKNNMHHMLNVFPIGTFLLQYSSTNSVGFANNTHVCVHVKTIGIFEFLDDLETAGCLMKNNKLIAMVSVKDIRTNP